jgi:hypothetical protein
MSRHRDRCGSSDEGSIAAVRSQAPSDASVAHRAPCGYLLAAMRSASLTKQSTPQHILWDSRLREASVIRSDERNHRDARDVVTVLEIILALLGLAAVLWGSLTWDPCLQPPLLGAGVLTLIGGAAALSVFVLEDQVAIGVVGGSGPPR